MKFEGTRISDLKAGETISGLYILRSAELKVSSNKKTYIDLVLSDSTGEIPAKWWDTGEDQFNALVPNKLFHVSARVDLWRDAPQLNISMMRIAGEEEQKRISEFVQSAPWQPEKMLEAVYAYTAKIRSPEIRNIVMAMLDRKEDKLIFWPAAKSLHHSVRSGLLYHILRMLQCAEALSRVYDGINTDLLFAGVIIHDLSKIGELSANELGMAEYTKEGQLLGHIVMGVEEVDRIGRETGASEEVILLLKHMIISHHYEAEYGSPKKPAFLEAELLHHIDMIDARVYDYQNATRNLDPGSFSDPVWSLDKRCIYKPMLKET
ncbi:MAG TPA: HD domain-containing protein [Thermoclostridium caenicola]|uniref:3'-5' exoribonuclease n=1 Tax=Thermoclostridium caenicola TaxID=659425 RepID=A0A1M6JK25_9FIRM|nr:HD domain-containing protein [Thermoclostridium caenicola]SHJ47004.1 3'-5' exoribonuclease [Thermoclostridium caenicola]HOK42351.1 HD domain-containing protein [Thermoclostridium caenicola]HOP71834.1 HD domain-containing protein [Thermoclostridium caenicola]HPO76454.1 HD domain-containing protein [Thermoclostridium caenicola]HPU21496.1 HD domain-containing protein [Thermoclostridium caenicola]